MLQAVLRRTHKVYQLYLDRQVPRAAAAMSYYLTMSLFPLIVCLYTLLGRNYQTMLQMLELADRVVSPETTRYLKGFLLYVANHPGTGMLLAAVHEENGEEKLHLLMVDPHIPAGAKLC